MSPTSLKSQLVTYLVTKSRDPVGSYILKEQFVGYRQKKKWTNSVRKQHANQLAKAAVWADTRQLIGTT